MNFDCEVVLPLYTKNNKHYIDVSVPCEYTETIRNIHNELRSGGHFQDPLEGSVLKVKVPHRNNRVSCRIIGLTPVQELARGDRVWVDIKFCGLWKAGDYQGVSWKLNLIETPTTVGPRAYR